MWFLKLSAALAGVHEVQASAKAASHIQRISAKDALIQGSASRQLAMFQKYAENLVVSQLQNKEAPDPTEMLEIIDAFIVDMHLHSLGLHESDEKAGELCQARFESCDADHWDESTHTELDILDRAVNTSRLAQKECLDVQAEACEASHPFKGFKEHTSVPNTCDEYSNYRKHTEQTLLPNCAKLTANIPIDEKTHGVAALIDDFIAADESTTEGASNLKTMEACLKEMKDWVDDGYPGKAQAMVEEAPWLAESAQYQWPGPPGLYPRYETCSDNERCCLDPASCMEPPEEPGFCCTRQSTFQDAHCAYELVRHDKCQLVISCHREKENDCKTDCAAVDLRVISRQADNESMERIQCLLQVITTEDAAQKQIKLNLCKSSLGDDNDFARSLQAKRDFWVIDGCPPDLNPPASDAHCHLPLPLQTCGSDFKAKEYETWHSTILCSCTNYCDAVMQASYLANSA